MNYFNKCKNVTYLKIKCPDTVCINTSPGGAGGFFRKNTFSRICNPCQTDKMKSRFIERILHEFRTPLTLILGPSENILKEAPRENAKKQAGAIKRNASRLLGFVNQLLDLSRLEAGRLELKASKDNIVSFIKGIAISFESIAERKDISLKIIPEKELIEMYFDKEAGMSRMQVQRKLKALTGKSASN